MTGEGNPECFYHPLFFTPATCEPGSTVFKNLDALLDFRQREKNHKGNKSRKKTEKNRRTKTLKEKAFVGVL